MLALTVVWALHGTGRPAATTAQLELLGRLAGGAPTLALQLTPPRILDRDAVLPVLRIESTNRITPGGAGLGRNEQPLAVLPRLPAGRYRVVAYPRQRQVLAGWIILGVGQDQFALRSQPIAPIEIDLPVDVRALVVRGDEEARRSVGSIVVEPLSLVPLAQRLTSILARRAVKYPSAAVFFLDEGSFPEPDAFWVGGSRQGSFVIQPDRPTGVIGIAARNAPVANRVIVESGQWREALTLAPGEERRIDIPVAPGQRAALVTAISESGFRPSETVPDSQDQRFLGVWLQVGVQNLTTPPK
jgi:hypothetical protein